MMAECSYAFKNIICQLKSMPVRAYKKKKSKLKSFFVDPKRLRASSVFGYVMRVGVGLKEKEKTGGRERERPPAYSPADLKCVLSRAIFSRGNGQKSRRNTADNRKKIIRSNLPLQCG